MFIYNDYMQKAVQEMQRVSVAMICRCVDIWIEN